MFRRALVVLVLASGTGCGGSTEPTATPTAAPQRPNVVLIAVDDLRPELGIYGRGYIKSPNIDRIGKEGVTFNRAYVQQAVCSPSRTSLLTGARPDTTRVWDLNTHFRVAMPDVVTLGQHFRNNGYFVQGMGKIYHGGFDDPPSWSVPWTRATAVTYALPENAALASGPAFEGADVPDNTFIDGKVADLATAALRDLANKSEPFLLAVGFARPHLPFVSPRKYWDLYDPATIELAPNKFRPRDAPDFAVLSGSELRSYAGIPQGSVPDDLARKLKHGYYAGVSYTDAQVGKVLDELDRLDLRKNTIVVLWGDHGWKLGEHDAWTKHSNTELDTRGPLLMSAPGLKAVGVRTEALVETVDVYPTLIELAGLPMPTHLEGVSFKPLLDNPQRAWKTAAFSQYPRQQSGGEIMGYAMVTDRYRMVQWVRRSDASRVVALELYDHANDPQENQNIAQRPEHAALVKTLQDKLNAGWRAAKPAGA